MFKKYLTSLILWLVAIGGFLGVWPTIQIDNSVHIIWVTSLDQAYAASWDPVKETDDEATRKLYNGIATTVNLLLDLLTILVTPAIMLAGWLISPDWTSGDLFNLRPTIHSLWVVVSNIVYFIYAILLIVIALATIFNSEHYGYKAMLPKLALGIILVPLTWWAVQFTISLATYVTASVVSIPHETMFKLDESKCSWDSKNCWQNRPSIPKEITFINAPSWSSKELADSYNQSNAASSKWVLCSAESCYTPKQFLQSLWWTYGHLIVYAYDVFRISDVKQIDTKWNKVSSIIWIIHQWIIGSILFAVFWVLILALVAMLFLRAIKLWFYAIFSPLFTLHFVTWGAIFWWEWKESSFNIKEFIGLAFLPAVVGLALSFWLVIIGAIQSTSEQNPNIQPCNKDNIVWDSSSPDAGCKILGFMGNDNNKIVKILEDNWGSNYITVNKVIIWWITFKFYGEPVWQAWVAKVVEDANNSTGVIWSASGTIGTLIVDIIAIIFIWVAFMAAKGISKAVSAVVDPFEKMGKNIGDLGMKLPKYMPLPIPGGSIQGMEKSSWMINQLVDAKFDKDFKSKWLGKRLNDALWGWSTEEIARFRQATKATHANQALKDTSAIATDMRNNGRGETLYKSEEFRSDLKELIKRMKKEGVADTEIHKIGWQWLVDLVKKVDKDGNWLNDDDITKAMAHFAWNRESALNVTSAKNYLDRKWNTDTTSSTQTNNINIRINTDDKTKPVIKIGDTDIKPDKMDGSTIGNAIIETGKKFKKNDFTESFTNALAETNEYWKMGEKGRVLNSDWDTLLKNVISTLDNNKAKFSWVESK